VEEAAFFSFLCFGLTQTPLLLLLLLLLRSALLCSAVFSF
jgi:hypothetical protein